MQKYYTDYLALFIWKTYNLSMAKKPQLKTYRLVLKSIEDKDREKINELADYNVLDYKELINLLEC